MFRKKNATCSSIKPLLVLTLLVIVLGIPAIHAQKYSDWSAPVNLGPVVNSTFSDQQPAISKDGRSLYFTSNRPGGVGGFDIYVSQRESEHDPWSSPMNLGPNFNTPSNEGNPVFSRDGYLMFFQSDRPGGLGSLDIWVSRRCHKHDDFNWQQPVNVGAGVNSTASDNGPAYFENDENGDNDEDGNAQLFFASNRSGGLGALDIYVSEQAGDGSFGPAILVVELSSTGADSRPTIRRKGLEIIFQSDRVGTLGLVDLWVATRKSTLEAWSIPVNLGDTVNTAFSEQNPYLSSNGKTLFFASDRPGGSGESDLYMSTRKKLRKYHMDHDNDDGDNH